MMKKVSKFISDTAESIKSLVKLTLQSKKVTIREAAITPTDTPIVILGNGPSLKETIQEKSSSLKKYPKMAVNFAAIAPEFIQLCPEYYILIDPHFFSNKEDDNLQKLWLNLSKVHWRMVLIVPAWQLKNIPNHIKANDNISIATINAIGIGGWKWLKHWSYNKAYGMPRPRNVLIPAIMAAIQMGYSTIYVTGADHSWLKTISVDDENHVVSIQPHFYKEDDKEIKRINTEYLKYPLHQILESFYIAFKSYHVLQEYAKSQNINIYNATPGSYIDAFPRKSL